MLIDLARINDAQDNKSSKTAFLGIIESIEDELEALNDQWDELKHMIELMPQYPLILKHEIIHKNVENLMHEHKFSQDRMRFLDLADEIETYYNDLSDITEFYQID